MEAHPDHAPAPGRELPPTGADALPEGGGAAGCVLGGGINRTKEITHRQWKRLQYRKRSLRQSGLHALADIL